MGIYRHSFAKAWLYRLGNEIFINGTNFLEGSKVKDKFKIEPLNTFIKLGDELINESELSEIVPISYPDMKKLGLAIYRFRAGDKAWRTRQEYVLIIAKRKSGNIPVPETTIRRRNSTGKCILEWDKLNKVIRGVGEDFGIPEGQFGNGDITPWIPYGEKSQRGKNLHVLSRHDSFDAITEGLFDSWEGKPQKMTAILDIKEMPIMITTEGKLLCMPYDKDYVPKMVMVGLSGSGKSFTLSSILGRAFLIFHDNAGLLNDSLNQFYDLMIPMDSKAFKRELRRVGNIPCSLPVVNLYMSCPYVKMKYTEENIGYRLVIPFKDFLYRYKFFTYGVDKWNLGKPEKYLTKDVVNALDNCKNAEDVKRALYSLIPNAAEDKGVKAMIYKWEAAFESIFRDEFTSNLFKHEEMTAPYWRLKTKDGDEYSDHPFIISAYAGLFPIINNAFAKELPIAQKQLADIIRKIVRWQMKMDDKKKRIWIGIDELKDLLGKKGSDVYDALDYLFTQGRFPKIGFVGNLQEYTKMSDSMKNNTTHLVVFDLLKETERKAIAADYRIKERLEEMAQLKENQCIFITKKKMVVYSSDGKREVKKAGEGGIWKGKILPPVTVHKKPSD